MEAMLKSGNGHIKIGLIVGIVGFVVVVFFSFGGSFCGGLFSSIVLGSVAGFLTSRHANAGTRDNASKLGTVSGGIAGIFALLAQVSSGLLPSLMIAILGAYGRLPGDVGNLPSDVFSMFFLPSVLNGIIGLIAAGIAGSIAASKGFDS